MYFTIKYTNCFFSNAFYCTRVISLTLEEPGGSVFIMTMADYSKVILNSMKDNKIIAGRNI